MKMKPIHQCICRFLPAAAALFSISLGARAASETFAFAPGTPVPSGSLVGLTQASNPGSTINVIQSVSLTLNISGTPGLYYNGDTYAYLRLDAPNGGTGFTILLNRPGRTAGNPDGYADSGLDVTFTASAANGDIHLYQNVTNPGGGILTGTWQPDGRNTNPANALDTDAQTALLSSFNGLSAKGTWTLFLADLVSGSDATLNSWSFTINGLTGPFFWKGATDGTWSNIGTSALPNWAADAAGTIPILATPDATEDVIFSASGAAHQNTTLGADFTIQSLTIQDPAAVTIGGANTLTVSGGGITVDPGAGLFTVNSNLTLAGASNTIAVGNAAGMVVNGILGGTTGLTKAGPGKLTLTAANNYTGTTTINAGTLRTQNASALSTGPVILNASAILSAGGPLTISTLNWNGGNVQLAPAAGDVLHVTNTFTNGGSGGAYLIDATGLTPGTVTLTTFGTTNFLPGDFTAAFLNAPANVTFQGQFLLTQNAVQLTIAGATATGPLLQNSAPVNVPTFADFLVAGPVTTGARDENNQIHSLQFQSPGSLTIFNTLLVTAGHVELPAGSGIILGAPGGPNGSLGANLTVRPGAVLSGNGSILGNLYNYGVVSPGFSPGKIRVAGDYLAGRSGTLLIQIGGRNAGQYDTLNVAGHAALDGTLALEQLNQFRLKRGDNLTFLTADQGVNGKFAAVSNPFANDTILSPVVVYHDDSVSLEVDGQYAAFADRFSLTPNQKAVARALDSVIRQDHGADPLIRYLDRQSLSKLPHDFDRIAPEELTSVFTISNSLANVQSLNIQRRTDDIRTGSRGFNAANLALNGDNPSYSGSFGAGVAGPNGGDIRADEGKAASDPKGNAPVATIPGENRWGAFLSGTGEWVSVGNDGNARGYDLQSGGFTLGLDYQVTPNFAIGLAAGYTGTTADLTEGGRVYVNGGKIGLYATYYEYQQVKAAPTMSKDASKEGPAQTYAEARGLYADVAVFGGYNSYHTHRAALQDDATGDTDGGELNALFGLGYDFRAGHLTFGPTAAFNYTYAGLNGFTEHGSLAPLDVHSGQTDSLRSAFGLKASYDWKVGGIVIKPEIRAAWQHEYGDTAYDLASNFANGAGHSFLVNGPKLGRDSVLLGAGLALQFNDRLSAYLYYDGELGRKNYQSTSVTGGFRIDF